MQGASFRESVATGITNYRAQNIHHGFASAMKLSNRQSTSLLFSKVYIVKGCKRQGTWLLVQACGRSRHQWTERSSCSAVSGIAETCPAMWMSARTLNCDQNASVILGAAKSQEMQMPQREAQKAVCKLLHR